MRFPPHSLAPAATKHRRTDRTARPGLLAVLGLAALAACGGDASSTRLELPDAGAPNELGAQSDPGHPGDARTDASPPTPAPSSFDTSFQTLLADLQAQPAERQPFTRYVGLAHRRRAGASEAELTAERAALSLILNSASMREALAPAVTVGAEALFYRIDLRDYGWDRELGVAGVTHRDGWDAIIAGNPYAVTFSGSEADELARLAHTVVPFVYAEAVVRGVTSSDVYHALASVPENLYSALPPWGVDRDAAWADLAFVRAANTESPHITREEDRISERFLMPNTELPLWLSVGMFSGGASTIFSDPVDYGDGETFAMFSLPNGLVGYGTYAQSGERRTASEGLPELKNPSSCFGCHVEGPLRMVDLVRDYVERYQEQFDTGTADAVRAVYLPQEALDAIFASDQAAYRSKLTALGFPGDLGADVIKATLDRFERPLSLAQAAAELGVEPARLSSSLSELGPELVGLAEGGEITRSDFSRLFAASLCSLHSEAPGHRPVTPGCPRR
jgi:hypothetical protein